MSKQKPGPASPANNQLTQALQLHQAGKLSEAEKIYRGILATNPRHAHALCMMGMIAHSTGKLEIAEELVRRAIAEKSDNASFHHILGTILNAQAKLEEAAISYQNALILRPGVPEYLNNLGVIFISLKRYEEAIDVLKQLLDITPQHFMALSNMGAALQNQKKYQEALVYYQQAIALKNDVPTTHYDMGLVLKELGKASEAVASFKQAIELKPDYSNAFLQAAQILRDQNKNDEALEYFRRAAAISPNSHAEANIGQILNDMGLPGEAIIHHERARKLAPKSYEILNNMGITYKKLSRYEEALECYLEALEIKPDVEDILSNISAIYKNLGRMDESLEFCRKAVALAPEKTWIHSNLLLGMIYASTVSPEELMEEALEFGKKTDRFLGKRTIQRNKNPDRKLRIGYVTADFKDHAVNYFFEPLLNTHDRNNFETYAYANVEIEDDVTNRLKKKFDHWNDIKYMSDDQAADLIDKDKIDILVDISGHTRGNRLMVFARKPAPIQITWLAYPGTTGMKAMDYRITDPYAEPPGMTEHLNVETLWRLPEIFCCYQAHESNPPVIPHPPFDDNGYVTFGCFNNFSKVTDPVLDAWAKIMSQVPDSRLLLEIAGIEGNKIRGEIEDRMKEHGLPLERITLEARKKSNQFVLYNEIDLALDPFPCVGGTTSMDTLWMGVPLVTLAGRHAVSRTGVTVLTNVGLPELITNNVDEYINLAVDLARNPEKIRTLRNGLRERTEASPLMNQEKFTRNLEAAYREMWKKYCNK